MEIPASILREQDERRKQLLTKRGPPNVGIVKKGQRIKTSKGAKEPAAALGKPLSPRMTKFHAQIILCSRVMKIFVKSFENATERHQERMKLLPKKV